MITKIVRTTTISGLTLLLIAGIFLAIGHNPDDFFSVYQAEVAGNYAFGLLVVSVLLSWLEEWLSRPKVKSKSAP